MALSDPESILASPLTNIDRGDERQGIEAIVGVINQYQVGQIVVGKQAEKVEAFVQKLCRHTEVPVEFRDERLTTVSARRLMQDTSAKKNRRKARDDAVAAALILQGYLDETQNS